MQDVTFVNNNRNNLKSHKYESFTLNNPPARNKLSHQNCLHTLYKCFIIHSNLIVYNCVTVHLNKQFTSKKFIKI